MVKVVGCQTFLATLRPAEALLVGSHATSATSRVLGFGGEARGIWSRSPGGGWLWHPWSLTFGGT